MACWKPMGDPFEFVSFFLFMISKFMPGRNECFRLTWESMTGRSQGPLGQAAMRTTRFRPKDCTQERDFGLAEERQGEVTFVDKYPCDRLAAVRSKQLKGQGARSARV